MSCFDNFSKCQMKSLKRKNNNSSLKESGNSLTRVQWTPVIGQAPHYVLREILDVQNVQVQEFVKLLYSMIFPFNVAVSCDYVSRDFE